MHLTTHITKRMALVLAGAAAFALLAVPSALASTKTNGMVATTLGSQDPRDTARSEDAAGLVPTRLGSPDPRENARTSSFSAGLVADRLGSPDPRTTANESVPAELRGPVRPDGAALRAVFNELAAQASSSRTYTSSSGASANGSTDSGFSWRDAGIGGSFALFLVGLVGLAWTVATHGRKKLARA
jgi:hypothetical protein